MHFFSPKIGGEYTDIPCCCARFMGWFGICRIILDSDADTIVGKVEMHGADADVPLSEQVGLIRVDLTPCFIFTHAH
jgi:hypothetical protein